MKTTTAPDHRRFSHFPYFPNFLGWLPNAKE